MITSSNGSIFCVTDPLCGEFTGHKWFPLTKASDAELWCFVWSAHWINGWATNQDLTSKNERNIWGIYAYKICKHEKIIETVSLQEGNWFGHPTASLPKPCTETEAGFSQAGMEIDIDILDQEAGPNQSQGRNGPKTCGCYVVTWSLVYIYIYIYINIYMYIYIYIYI